MSFADVRAAREPTKPKIRQPESAFTNTSGMDRYEQEFRNERQNELQGDVDDGLDNILRTTENIKQTGADTNMKLALQGAQLRRALVQTDELDENMDQAEYHMARMELCCCVAMCCCCCTCCQPKKAVTERKYKPGSGAFKEPLLDKAADYKGKGPRAERLDSGDDPSLSSEAKFEKRYNKKLDGVLQAVQDIQEMSEDMHEEIQYQNRELIPTLDQRVGENRDRVKDGERRARKL